MWDTHHDHAQYERTVIQLLFDIRQQEETLMSATTDLQAAVAKIQTDVTALLAAQSTQAGAVAATDAEAATAALTALDAQVVAATAAPSTPAGS